MRRDDKRKRRATETVGMWLQLASTLYGAGTSRRGRGVVRGEVKANESRVETRRKNERKKRSLSLATQPLKQPSSKRPNHMMPGGPSPGHIFPSARVYLEGCSRDKRQSCLHLICHLQPFYCMSLEHVVNDISSSTCIQGRRPSNTDLIIWNELPSDSMRHLRIPPLHITMCARFVQ